MPKNLLTETQLRFILREALLLLEGFKQDKEEILELVKDNSELVEKVSNFKPPAISWLVKRYGTNAKIQESHPIADSIVTLEKYIAKVPQIKARWQNRSKKDYGGRSWGEILALSYKQNNINPSWKKPPYDWENVNSWSQSPMDWIRMTSDEMSQIMILSDLKKSKNTVKEEDPPQKLIKKVGPWNIWLPETKSDSIRIAGYDPITMKSHVTWCTARGDGSNLFYNYNEVGKYLIYIIKDNPRPTPEPFGEWDYISIGVRKGKIVEDTGVGGSTVNRENNKGLPRGKFWNEMKSATEPYYDQIMSVVKQIADNYNDSPSIDYQLKSLQDPAIMRHVIGSLGFREKISELRRLRNISRQKGITPTPEVKSVVIDLLKIGKPGGVYNLEKFESIGEALQTIDVYDEKYFEKVNNLEHLFSLDSSQHYPIDRGMGRSEAVKSINKKIVILSRIMHARVLGEKESVAQITKKIRMLSDSKETILTNTAIFPPESRNFLISKIDEALRSFKSIASLVENIKSINSVSDAENIYAKGFEDLVAEGYDSTRAQEVIDNVFIEVGEHAYLPLNLVSRNTRDRRIRNKILIMDSVLEAFVRASTSKESATSFYRENREIVDLAFTSIQGLHRKRRIFIERLITSFDIMTAEEVFSIVNVGAKLLSASFSRLFQAQVNTMKDQQPEKFEYIRKKVSEMIFPPKVITDAFGAKIQSVDDFLDDLLGDDLLQI